MILLAYRFRNPLTHSPEDWPASQRDKFLPAGLVFLLAPLIKHYDTLQQRLDGLIASPILDLGLLNLLSLIQSERQGHLDFFAGRQKDISEIRQRLESDLRKSGGYCLLVGQEGIGKSALCAKISSDLSNTIKPCGRFRDEVRKYAPWLPSVIFISGKQSRQRDEIVRLIIAQVNALLLNPIPLPPASFVLFTQLVAKICICFFDKSVHEEADCIYSI